MEHTSHSSSRESRTDSNAARVQGGRPLNGVVPVGGSRNAALSIMAASLLADGPVNLQGVPRVSDVAVLCGMLVQLGVDVRRLTGDRLRLETVDREPTVVPEKLIQRSRAGFLALGPLLARRGRATVALPGICALGDRPVDVPLRGLAALGADVRVQGGCVVAKARHLRGASIDLRGERGTTVSGTANVLCAATLAQGETVLTGAAAEPEIVDLCRFLQAMGARVEGVGTSTLRVRGVSQLNGPTYGVIPDRLEAATLLIAAAAVGGRVTATGLIPKHLDAVLDWLRQAGCELWVGGDWVTVERRGPLTPCNVSAAAYPGIPSDLQPALTVLLALAHGKSRVSDSVFPWRFGHLNELRRLGASVRWDADLGGSPGAAVSGVMRLGGAEIHASDSRSCAALLIAGLAADGDTTLHGLSHLDCGYDRLDQKLASLGGAIQRDDKTHSSLSPQRAGDPISA